MPDADNDFLDGEDEHGSAYDPEKHTEDDQLAGIVLFADVDWTDPEAVAERKAEWEALDALPH